jgi:ribosomal protein L20
MARANAAGWMARRQRWYSARQNVVRVMSLERTSRRRRKSEKRRRKGWFQNINLAALWTILLVVVAVVLWLIRDLPS